jgi:hypothetical protein
MSRARWRILQPVLVFSDTQHKGFDERRGTRCRLLKEGVSTIGRPGLPLFTELPRVSILGSSVNRANGSFLATYEVLSKPTISEGRSMFKAAPIMVDTYVTRSSNRKEGA